MRRSPPDVEASRRWPSRADPRWLARVPKAAEATPGRGPSRSPPPPERWVHLRATSRSTPASPSGCHPRASAGTRLGRRHGPGFEPESSTAAMQRAASDTVRIIVAYTAMTSRSVVPRPTRSEPRIRRRTGCREPPGVRAIPRSTCPTDRDAHGGRRRRPAAAGPARGTGSLRSATGTTTEAIDPRSSGAGRRLAGANRRDGGRRPGVDGIERASVVPGRCEPAAARRWRRRCLAGAHGSLIAPIGWCSRSHRKAAISPPEGEEHSADGPRESRLAASPDPTGCHRTQCNATHRTGESVASRRVSPSTHDHCYSSLPRDSNTFFAHRLWRAPENAYQPRTCAVEDFFETAASR